MGHGDGRGGQVPAAPNPVGMLPTPEFHT